MKRTVEKLIGKLKREPDYRLSPALTVGDLFGMMFVRVVQAVRGTWHKSWGLRGACLPVFAGRHLSLRSMRRFRAGRSLIIEDNVQIWALSSEGVRLGRNVTLARGSVLQASGVMARPGVGIALGDHVAVGVNNFLGGQGGISIGAHTIMGPDVRIFSEDHDFDDPDELIRKQGERRARVTIGENCWIGSGALILAGSDIGAGSVVGGGAVVKGTFPPNSLIVGIPGRRLRSRVKGDDSGAAAASQRVEAAKATVLSG